MLENIDTKPQVLPKLVNYYFDLYSKAKKGEFKEMNIYELRFKCMSDSLHFIRGMPESLKATSLSSLMYKFLVEDGSYAMNPLEIEENIENLDPMFEDLAEKPDEIQKELERCLRVMITSSWKNSKDKMSREDFIENVKSNFAHHTDVNQEKIARITEEIMKEIDNNE